MASQFGDLFKLDGKVAVIIGGGGGMGSLISTGLGQQGAKIAIASRKLEKLEEAAREIGADIGAEVSTFQVDVVDEKSVAQLVEQVISKFGTVDILVNSYGWNVKRPATEFPVEDWEKLFKINVTGLMIVCREFGKILVSNKKGKIINMSSVRGTRATLWGGNEGYCASKGAVDMLTRALAAEWAPYNINVNAIAPSIVQTAGAAKRTPTLQDAERLKKYLANVPLGRVGQPTDIVGAAIFLAAPASDFITGQILFLDGGLTAIG